MIGRFNNGYFESFGAGATSNTEGGGSIELSETADNCNFPVTFTDCTGLYYSCGCPMYYNPSTGVLYVHAICFI